MFVRILGHVWLVLAAAPIAAAATAKATTTTGSAEAKYHEEFAQFAVDQQIRLEILFAQLLGELQADAAIFIVYFTFNFIA
jgi:hypothetical protein